jgi:hypothetical protein
VRVFVSILSIPPATNPCIQIAGTDYNKSLLSFHFSDWNFAELIRVGIAKPLSQLNIQGVCECDGCRKSYP